MTVIGVLTETSSGKIEKSVKKMLVSGGVSAEITDSSDEETAVFKEKNDVLIVPMRKSMCFSNVLDILIMENCDLISYELLSCISSETKLIYNADKSAFRFIHPNAISYGMTYSADVTVSSIDDKFGDSFVFCLQRAVESINGNIFYAGEFTVEYEKTGINEILPAIMCAMLCDTFAMQKK